MTNNPHDFAVGGIVTADLRHLGTALARFPATQVNVAAGERIGRLRLDAEQAFQRASRHWLS